MAMAANAGHELALKGRKYLAISGVVKVDRFDEEEFLVETGEGYLLIRGEGLTLRHLDVEVGDIAIEGRIDEMLYLEEGRGRERRGLFGRLFG
ncbi:MAG: sporulation protein YabP [Brockia lithotrophica]|nr:sporulation protein YabP [Brockia lithotrophica]